MQLSASLALTADERAQKRQCAAEEVQEHKQQCPTEEKHAKAARELAAHEDNVARVKRDGVTLYGVAPRSQHY